MTYEFRYTNKQYFLKGCMGFFVILAVISFFFIVANLGDFMETHAIETIVFLIMVTLVGFSMFGRKGGKELKQNVRLSNNSFITDNHYFSLDELKLFMFKSDDYNAYLLMHSDKKFALYTNQKDDLIEKLLLSEIEKETVKVSDYKFDRNSATAFILHGNKNEFSFNLNSGQFSFYDPEEDEKPKIYNPENFIQTPYYKLKS